MVDVCKLVYVSSISKVRISDSEKQFLVDVCKLVYVSSLSKVRISDSEKQFCSTLDIGYYLYDFN